MVLVKYLQITHKVERIRTKQSQTVNPQPRDKQYGHFGIFFPVFFFNIIQTMLTGIFLKIQLFVINIFIYHEKTLTHMIF